MLPDEIILYIYDFLSYSDVDPLKYVNKRVYKTIVDYETNIKNKTIINYPQLKINEYKDTILFKVKNYGLSMEKTKSLNDLLNYFILCYGYKI